MDYIIAILRFMEFFYNCASKVTCYIHKNQTVFHVGFLEYSSLATASTMH